MLPPPPVGPWLPGLLLGGASSSLGQVMGWHPFESSDPSLANGTLLQLHDSMYPQLLSRVIDLSVPTSEVPEEIEAYEDVNRHMLAPGTDLTQFGYPAFQRDVCTAIDSESECSDHPDSPRALTVCQSDGEVAADMHASGSARPASGR